MGRTDTENEKFLFTWHGKPNTELSRKELIEVIEHLSSDINRMRKEHIRQPLVKRLIEPYIKKEDQKLKKISGTFIINSDKVDGKFNLKDSTNGRNL